MTEGPQALVAEDVVLDLLVLGHVEREPEAGALGRRKAENLFAT
jgi:hypothetical protein